MLYPNRKLPGFFQKNNVPSEQVADSALVVALTERNDGRLLIQDVDNVYHFNGRFRNAADVAVVLDELAQEAEFAELASAERDFILDLFEQTFNHHAFTGRSGTFFSFEGLGSIYWHMVSKLLLAVQECYQQAVADGAETTVVESLAAAYYDVRQGLSFNKTPSVYGAFPTDPYSHSPYGSGAKQPGMTGQVKEEILTRWGELGVAVSDGTLCFVPMLLSLDEFSTEPQQFDYVDAVGAWQTLSVPTHSLLFTYCQVPVIYTQSTTEQPLIEVIWDNGRSETIRGNCLDVATSKHIFARDGQVQAVRVIVTI